MTVLRPVRCAFRQCRLSPVFTAASVLTLALVPAGRAATIAPMLALRAE